MQLKRARTFIAEEVVAVEEAQQKRWSCSTATTRQDAAKTAKASPASMTGFKIGVSALFLFWQA